MQKFLYHLKWKIEFSILSFLLGRKYEDWISYEPFWKRIIARLYVNYVDVAHIPENVECRVDKEQTLIIIHPKKKTTHDIYHKL